VSALVNVYLAGGIHGKTDDECRTWRHVARVRLESWGYYVHDPLDRDVRGRDLTFGQQRRVCEADENAVQWCHILLVNAVGAGLGTGAELRDAFKARKYIVGFQPAPVSPWLGYQATVVLPGLYEALEHLRNLKERAA
jgi:hypothetical protein